MAIGHAYSHSALYYEASALIQAVMRSLYTDDSTKSVSTAWQEARSIVQTDATLKRAVETDGGFTVAAVDAAVATYVA